MHTKLFESKRQQFVALLSIWLFSSLMTAHFLFQNHTLYLDNHLLYGYYFNIMRSLNEFGEPAWWFPNHQYGIPAFLMALIGVVNASSPLFILMGSFFWIMGLCHVKIAMPLASYIILSNFLSPLLFLVSLWLLARQLFKSGIPIVVLLITAAFCPSIFQNLKDPGFLEVTSYGILFLVAFNRYIALGTKSSLLFLILLFFILAISAGFAMAVWNVWFILITILIPPLFNLRWRKLIKKRWGELKPQTLFVILGGSAICFLPKLLTYLNFRGEIIRFGMSSASYNFKALHSGNPWQLLLSSVPGIGFRNLPGSEFTHFVVAPEVFFPHPNYFGLICLPTILFGILYGRTTLRRILFTVMGTTFTVYLMGPSSPFLSSILIVLPFLTSINHYFDIVFGFGAVTLLLFAMAFGVETVIRKPQRLNTFFYLLVINGVFSLVFYAVNFPERKHVQGSFFGLYCLIFSIFALLFWKLKNARTLNTMNLLLKIFFLVVLMDVSTNQWNFIRENIQPLQRDYLDEPSENKLGTKDPTINMGLDKAFYFRTSERLREMGGDKLPDISLFNEYHTRDSTTPTDLLAAQNLTIPKIQIANDFAGSEEETQFLKYRTMNNLEVKSKKPLLKRIDYNSFNVEIQNPRHSLLLLKDSYFKGWTAEANGKPLRIFKALGGLKLVVITPEMTTIHFNFFPVWIAYSLAFGYLIILLVVVTLVGAKLRLSYPKIISTTVQPVPQ